MPRLGLGLGLGKMGKSLRAAISSLAIWGTASSAVWGSTSSDTWG